MVWDDPINYMSFSFVFPSVWIFSSPQAVCVSYNSLVLCIFDIEQKTVLKEILIKIDSILRKIFDMQFLFPVLIMFSLKIIQIYRDKWLTFLNCLIYDAFL